MERNPYQSPLAAPFSRPISVLKIRMLVSKAASNSSLAVAAVASLWMLVMLKWIDDVRPSDSLAFSLMAILWLVGPHLGSAGIAWLFRCSWAGSPLILLSVLASAAMGSWILFVTFHDGRLFHPAVPGLKSMNCFIPLELLIPAMQWLALPFIATAAAVALLGERFIEQRCGVNTEI